MIQPSDIFVIQAAIEQYQRKHPGSPTPSAEVALAWKMDRSWKRTKRSEPTSGSEASMFARIFENFRFLFKPLSSQPH